MTFIRKVFGAGVAILGVSMVSSVVIGVFSSLDAILPYVGFGIILGLFAFSIGLLLMEVRQPDS
jgi:hypothetical protein